MHLCRFHLRVRKVGMHILNQVGRMSLYDRRSVHILAGEEIIHLRKACESPLCRSRAPQLCFPGGASHLVKQVLNAAVLPLHRHIQLAQFCLSTSAR